jgi:hypothetical protein
MQVPLKLPIPVAKEVISTNSKTGVIDAFGKFQQKKRLA